MGTIDDLLAKFKSYDDKIFISPLNVEEIDAFEKELNITFPASFRTYLSKIGIFQDLITENIFTKKSDFIWEKEFIDDLLKDEERIYFGFGSNESGDIFVLKDASLDDEYIYKLFHETGKIKRTIGTFVEFLEKAALKMERQVKKRKLNKNKYWVVQFSFDVEDATEIIEILRERFTIRGFENKWLLHETTPSGVSVFYQTFKLNGVMITINKSEYDQWYKPNLNFNFQESILVLKKGSVIEEMDSLFRRSEINYKLIDYGIL